jgi:hypothetical protein
VAWVEVHDQHGNFSRSPNVRFMVERTTATPYNVP